jgi:DNA-binding LacI/PurR family transcriptional regulator
MKMTMKEIAAMAGVSRFAVSAVVNNNFNSTRVSEKKRKKIEQLVKQYSFMPNATAQSLVKKETRIINVMVPSVTFFDGNSNPKFIMGVQEAIEQEGWRLKFTTLNWRYQDYKCLEHVMADAILTFYWGPANKPAIEKFKTLGCPVVVAYSRCDIRSVTNIYYDNRTAMYELTKGVIKAGHQRIMLVEAYAGDRFHIEGRTGLEQAVAEARNVEIKKVRLPFTVDQVKDRVSFMFNMGKSAMAESLKDPFKPSVIMFNDDTVALGAMQQARNQGLSIPDDLSITGNGDASLAADWDPPLTTVENRAREAGRLAGETLLKLIRKEPVKQKLIKVPLKPISRNSVKNMATGPGEVRNTCAGPI